MKPSAIARIRSRVECWTTANQPTGLSVADNPPDASTPIGWAASASAVTAISAASCTAYTAQNSRTAQRQKGDGILPSGKSKITAANRTRPGVQS